MGEGDLKEGDGLRLKNVFTDTCVLLNYVQRGIEPDYSSDLIDGNQIDIVVGVTVSEELDDVSNRRDDIYTDFVDFLTKEEGQVGEYDPYSRRPYFQENDSRHVRELQMNLSQIDERAEVQRQVRLVTRMFLRRLEYLREEVIPQSMFESQPGITLLFALSDVVQNDKDRNVIADAALWAAEGEHSSKVFATLDKDDILDVADEINELLCEERGSDWKLKIVHPNDLPELVGSEL